MNETIAPNNIPATTSSIFACLSQTLDDETKNANNNGITYVTNPKIENVGKWFIIIKDKNTALAVASAACADGNDVNCSVSNLFVRTFEHCFIVGVSELHASTVSGFATSAILEIIAEKSIVNESEKMYVKAA